MNSIVVKKRGLQPYAVMLEDMQRFTNSRTESTPDEIWVLQHLPVYTLGQAGDPEHILNAGEIPVVQSDRGGQVTYHGPGQLIIYPLIDLRRYKLGVRSLVELLEDVVILLLSEFGIDAENRRDAPGVYVAGRKIAALGLRIRHSCSFHGLSLNIDMDLEPFARINPCGYQGLEVTQLSQELPGERPDEQPGQQSATDIDVVADRLTEHLIAALELKSAESNAI